jgi:hypothetical protein
MDANRGEYTAITFVEMFLIIGGLLYYAVAFAFDLMLVLCPNSARAVAGGFSRGGPLSGGGGLVAGSRQSLSGAERRALVAARKTVHSLASVASDAGDSTGSGSVGDAGGGMSVNPFMAARLRKGGSVRTNGGDDDHDDMAATVSAVMALELPPDTEQWVAVKTVFASLQENVAQLQGLLKAQNRDAARSLDARNLDGRERSRSGVARSARLSPPLEEAVGNDASYGSGSSSGAGVGRGPLSGSAGAAFAASAATQALKARVGGRKLKPIGLTDGSVLLGGGGAAMRGGGNMALAGVRSAFTPMGAASATASSSAAAGSAGLGTATADGGLGTVKAARGAGGAGAAGSAAADAIATATLSLQRDPSAAWAASNPLWADRAGSNGHGGADAKPGETRRTRATLAPATGGVGIGRIATRLQRTSGAAAASTTASASSAAAATAFGSASGSSTAAATPAAAASGGARVRIPRPTTEPGDEDAADYEDEDDAEGERDDENEEHGEDAADGADWRSPRRVAVVRVRPDGSKG